MPVSLPSTRRTSTRRPTSLPRLAAALDPALSFSHVVLSLLTVLLLSLPAAAHAQGPGSSRIDIYAGYGYFHPVNSDINNVQYQPIVQGAVGSVSGYFTKHIGLQVEGSYFPPATNDCVYTAQAGPVVRYQFHRFVPFGHALFGGAKVGGPIFQPCTWGIGATGGIGFDYILPRFGDHLAIRPIQADYEYSNVNNGPLVLPAGVSGGTGEINAFRLSGGLVVRLGGQQPTQPVSLACYVQPDPNYPGDPVTLTASPGALNLRRKVTYTWASTGGTITGAGAAPTLDTTGLAPGTYTITGHISQGKHPIEQASCTASFTLRPFDPPTLSCSATPSSVSPGQGAVITSTGVSPQNRPLTYSYTSSAGQVAGSGNTANLDTDGVPPSTITVNCTTVDDLGHQAQAQATVTITAPIVPPAPLQRQLCTLQFTRDRRRPARVDNEAKGCLDDIALSLNRESSAKLVIVGQNGPEEPSSVAAERTLNVQQYLIKEKGIDPSRIELLIGISHPGRSVDNYFIPSGATFKQPALTNAVDSSKVQRHGQAYGTPTQHFSPAQRPKPAPLP